MQSQVRVMFRCGVGLNPLKDVQIRAPTSLCHGQIWTKFGQNVAKFQIATPDDGCREHPKHVE